VQDAGNLPGATFAVDHDSPGARNLAAVSRVAREVADAIAAADDGRLPLVVGGDCIITLGVIAGLRRRHPDVGLVYVDGDSDVSVPGDGGSRHTSVCPLIRSSWPSRKRLRSIPPP
jgi:arginase